MMPTHARTAHHRRAGYQHHHHHPVSLSSILRTSLRRFLANPPICVWVLGLLVGPMFLWYHGGRTEEAYLSLENPTARAADVHETVLDLTSALPEDLPEEDEPVPPEESSSDEDPNTEALTSVGKVEETPSEASAKPKVTKALEVISRIKSLTNPGASSASRASSVKSANAAVKLNAERSKDKKFPKDIRAGKPGRTAPSRPLSKVSVPVKLPSRKEVKELVHLEAGRMKIARQCDEAEQSGDKEQLKKCRMMKMYGDDAAKLADATPQAVHERENDVMAAILRGQQKAAELVAQRKAAMGIVDTPKEEENSNDSDSDSDSEEKDKGEDDEDSADVDEDGGDVDEDG
eukprot:CAMPEP_0118947900 /NCGR_PEP_ID=MMETSP1169-20130426/46858_1 /TAXON_ID=36882 /ORGANISM="Pyramimonas obovata, Strain CCMP722" /LENGTH=346 /DNA_ID=CAMNT_0006894207 /DNA_START=94 /DNA_END=1131 /DNA_ORIENTATION=-